MNQPVTAVTDDYYLEIEAHFAMRRGTPFILSAKDWALMTRWRAEGVPLPVVIEAIDTVFDKNETSGRRKVISSLSYCRHAVKEIWDERKEMHVGADGETPEASPSDLLEAVARDLESAQIPDGIGAEFAGRVRALTGSVPHIEEKLIDLERELIERILSAASLQEEVRSEAVRSIGKIDDKIRARTEEANVRRIVRERFGLPRLTLFR